MSIVKEFKEFVMRGSIIDLAVGVVIGGAFSKLVDGVVKGVIGPVVNVIKGEDGWPSLVQGIWDLGNGVLNFVLLAAVVFFIFVKPINKLRTLRAKPPEPVIPSGPPEDVKLLTEIRDLLKAKASESPSAPAI
ncbi:large conductance mechanosensitive channel [Prosthecobacter fusiformis]|uniref:Large-conductance mechanosensitive channel n=1 Tax=Prosthecobacter fusiformis TaxID=48464 RepID=A0A4R7RM55_9BACT|nr:large conductance mechanosensitive channel protein MscL [Prosthecobacter fusiformis]TDU64034.1 large conductance mechanosensitive channel [Prosthecobacter fusiformis]